MITATPRPRSTRPRVPAGEKRVVVSEDSAQTAAQVAYAAIFVGVVLLLSQYLSNPSLWVDELAVTHNVLERSYLELLTRPLSYDQVAPPLFLIIEKGAVALFGSREFVLRGYPVLMGAIALVLTWRASRQLLSPWFAVVPVVLLAVSRPAIWYGTQVKQYSSDAAAALAILCLTLALIGGVSRTRSIAIALGGALLPWLSMPSSFVLACAGGAILLESWRRREANGAWFAVVATWGVSTLLAMWTAQMRVTPETMAFMRDFWRDAFIVVPPTTSVEWRRPAFLLRRLFDNMFNGGPALLYLAFAAAGAYAIWRRSRPIALLLLGPCALALLAAALHAYPFDNRLALFLFPLLFVVTAMGAERVASLGAGRQRWWSWAITASLLVPSTLYLLAYAPPWQRESLRDVLARVAVEARKDDSFFVTYGAAQGWRYYAPRLALTTHDTQISACRDDAARGYVDEIDRLRGAGRVWIVHVPAGKLRDAKELLAAAAQVGHSLMSIERGDHFYEDKSAVGAYLFDFSSDAPPALWPRAFGERGGSFIPTPAPSCRGAAVVREDEQS
jgi:hypothetical protein